MLIKICKKYLGYIDQLLENNDQKLEILPI